MFLRGMSAMMPTRARRSALKNFSGTAAPPLEGNKGESPSVEGRGSKTRGHPHSRNARYPRLNRAVCG